MDEADVLGDRIAVVKEGITSHTIYYCVSLFTIYYCVSLCMYCIHLYYNHDKKYYKDDSYMYVDYYNINIYNVIILIIYNFYYYTDTNIDKLGRLRALGTAKFLKERFGLGYLMRMSLVVSGEKEGKENVNKILEKVQSFVPNALLSSHAGYSYICVCILIIWLCILIISLCILIIWL